MKDLLNERVAKGKAFSPHDFDYSRLRKTITFIIPIEVGVVIVHVVSVGPVSQYIY